MKHLKKDNILSYKYPLQQQNTCILTNCAILKILINRVQASISPSYTDAFPFWHVVIAVRLHRRHSASTAWVIDSPSSSSLWSAKERGSLIRSDSGLLMARRSGQSRCFVEEIINVGYASYPTDVYREVIILMLLLLHLLGRAFKTCRSK